MLELTRDIKTLPLSWWGRLAYFLLPHKKSRAKKNIDRVFQGSLSASDKKHLCMAYYSHMLASVKEIILYALVGRKRLQKRVKIIGLDYLRNAVSKGKGVLLLTGHLGNWEYAPLFFLEKFDNNTDVYCVRKKLRYPFLDAIFLRRFENSGFKIINDNKAVAHIRSALKHNGVVFFPFDVNPSAKVKHRVTTDFLGQKTDTNISLAYLASLYGSCVLSVTVYRTAKNQHVLRFFPEIEPATNLEYRQRLIENTRRYNKRLEEMLLLHPEQWLWSYKRWKNND